MTISAKKLSEFWYENFVRNGHCGLCGNSGIIDTRGIRTPAGLSTGDLFFCICPNGRSIKRQLPAGTHPSALRDQS